MLVAQHPFSASPQYYAECHGVIYVIDSTDEERLSESKRAFGGYSLARAGRVLGNGQVQSAHPVCLELALAGRQAHAGQMGPWPRVSMHTCREGGRPR